MDVLRKARSLVEVTWNKATEVANDINEKLEKRKQIRELLEEMADYEDAIINYVVFFEDKEEFDKLPDVIKDNADAIKVILPEIQALQTDDLTDEEFFEPEEDYADERFCTQCGKQIESNDAYCRHCGAKQ